MPVRVFQLPSCTSCRNAASWLAGRGIAYEWRHVWNEAPTRAELAELAAHLPGRAAGLLSRRSVRFRELGLADRTLSEEEILDLLAAEPRLLRRPIVAAGARVVVGFDRRGLEAMFG